MMPDYSLFLDLAFLLLAVYLFPGLPPAQVDIGTQTIALPPPSPAYQHIDTPLPSPLPPSISLTPPDAPIARAILTPPYHSIGNAHITATPSAAAQPIRRPAHRRGNKSVSFSLSSLSDILPPDEISTEKDKIEQEKEKDSWRARPPTPWMKGPASPLEIMSRGSSSGGSSPSLTPTPRGGKGPMIVEVLPESTSREDDPHAVLSPKICNRDIVDPMGIKKAWLM